MKAPEAHSPALRDHPSRLFVETTTRCNLGCIMCVKQAQGSGVVEGDLSQTTFAALAPAFPRLEALVLNGVGEPLLHPRLEEFIHKAKKIMPTEGWVGFQSNGLFLTNLRAIALVDAGLDRICLSIDAVSADMFSRVREGGELAAIEHALQALDAAKKICARPNFRIGVEFVLMGSNLHELPAVLRWAATRGVSFAIVTHFLPYDARQAGEALYGTCTDEAVSLFAAWEKRGRAEGIDIRRYPEVRWKYARKREEQRIVAMVEEMKREAGRRGIMIDLKKLLARDDRQVGEVAAVFAEAQQVAGQTGLELRLPEIIPREKRRCGFVEEGGAFVSWDGGVSPCYFLWHRYQCFASGWEQQVAPRVFGNLAERGILDIWNDPAFRAFREGVLAYDYPSCAGCSLAPCDYVQTAAFEQDCHIRNVPCGACLWCTGVFQCLN
ncbi:MAG TPA: radical SAM/SPASM domain-containing protein [Geobacteraceae bacterium]